MVENTACGKLPTNNIVEINKKTEHAMSSTTAYQKKERKKDSGMKVYFEFPEPTENDEEVKREVREILTNILQEHLRNIS